MTDSKNRIEINDAECITNGSSEQLESIQQPNAIGKVIQNDTNNLKAQFENEKERVTSTYNKLENNIVTKNIIMLFFIM